MIKIRYVTPTTYIDTSIWFIYEEPNTKEPILFKVPIDLTLVRLGRDLHTLRTKLQELYGEVELEDLGNWENVMNKDGFIKHPFTDEELKINKEL